MAPQSNVVSFPRSAKPVDLELQRYRLPKVKAFRDRLGRIKAYGRATGIEDQKLNTGDGFREFLIAYQTFMASLSSGTVPQVPVAKAPRPVRIKSGSTRAAIDGYMASDAWKILRPATASARKRILNTIAIAAGDEMLSLWDREMIQGKIDEKPITVRKNWKSAFRGLFKWAVETKFLAVNPSDGVKAATAETDGYRTWSESEIRRYLDKHPVGTMARRVFSLGLCTAQRRTDLARMGWGDIVDGRIRIKQSKTGENVSIPILGELAAELAFCPKDAAAFIVGATGKPLGPNALGDRFRAWVIEAGLPVTKLDEDGHEIGDKGLSLHGLRRAMCRRLVKAGVRYHTIMAITGHKTLEEIQRYCSDYEKEIEADKGIAAIEKHYGTAA
jgi:integrase